MKLLRVLNLAMIALTLCVVSCSGEDGRDGIGVDGTNGVDGNNGSNGENGTDGENGVGFDELTKYGFITMDLEGIRLDGVPFTDSSSFKFLGTSGQGISTTNSVVTLDNNFGFSVVRFLSSPDETFQNTALAFILSFEIFGDNSQEINIFQFAVNDYAVVGDDNKYFELSAVAPADFEITDLNFDEETNHLTFSYSFEVKGGDNATTNQLNISGIVDVTVLEVLE